MRSPESPVGGVRIRSWDHDNMAYPYKKADFRKLYFYPKKQSPETQLGVSGCVAGTTNITIYLTKKMTSENYIFIPKKLRPENPVGGVRMRSWDHRHHDIPLQKS